MSQENNTAGCKATNANRQLLLERALFTISSLRCELPPTCTLKWPRRNRVQITCNTSSAYHVQRVASSSSSPPPVCRGIFFVFSSSFSSPSSPSLLRLLLHRHLFFFIYFCPMSTDSSLASVYPASYSRPDCSRHVQWGRNGLFKQPLYVRVIQQVQFLRCTL